MAKISANVNCGSLRGACGGEVNVYKTYIILIMLPQGIQTFGPTLWSEKPVQLGNGVTVGLQNDQDDGHVTAWHETNT